MKGKKPAKKVAYGMKDGGKVGFKPCSSCKTPGACAKAGACAMKMGGKGR